MTVRTSRGHGSQPRGFPGQTGRTCNSWRGDWLRPQRREHGNQAGQAYNAQGTLSAGAQSPSRI